MVKIEPKIVYPSRLKSFEARYIFSMYFLSNACICMLIAHVFVRLLSLRLSSLVSSAVKNANVRCWRGEVIHPPIRANEPPTGVNQCRNGTAATER